MPRRESANADADHGPDRELLERMAVRLIVIAEECTDSAIRLKLRQLVDQLHSSFLRLDRAYAELNIVQDFIPVEHANRPGKRLLPTAITIHNTDNVGLGANAAAHAQYLKSDDARNPKFPGTSRSMTGMSIKVCRSMKSVGTRAAKRAMQQASESEFV